MSDSTVVRALMAQIDVNFALTEALLRIIIEANLMDSKKIENVMNEISAKNSELIEVTTSMINNSSKG